MKNQILSQYKDVFLTNSTIALFSYFFLLLISFCLMPIASGLIWMGFINVLSFLWIFICMGVLGYIGLKVVKPIDNPLIQLLSLTSPTLILLLIYSYIVNQGLQGIGSNYLIEIYLIPLTAMCLWDDTPNYFWLSMVPTLLLWLSSNVHYLYSK